MRIFRYKVEIDDSNGGESSSYTKKDLVCVENDDLSETRIKEKIKMLIFPTEDLLNIKLKQIQTI